MNESHYWETVAVTWGAEHPQSLWRVHSDAVNLELLGRWLRDERRKFLLKTDAFDEAFGNGLSPFLKAKTDHAVIVDVALSVLGLARARHSNLCVIGADARYLPFADGAFDAIVSTSTLDHFHSHAEVIASLQEFRRVLRPTGQLFLTLEPFRWLQRLGLVPYYVGVTYGPRRLRSVLQQVGFEVLEVSAVMHCPRVFAVVIARLLERHTGQEIHRRFLRFLLAFEHLAYWPTRFLTGHLVAVRATKR
ncbi:MAG: class I SAM-dependent methyltransferase [Deltaproteobacteria bacterium]|nr:class I SAM-dependent methyltransferase [Deltaproteobacteria bacterium]